MMINKIQNFNQNYKQQNSNKINFTSENKMNTDLEIMKFHNENSKKSLLMGLGAGVIAGGASLLINKGKPNNIQKSLALGAGVDIVVDLLSQIAMGAKNVKDANEQAKKYGQNDENKTGFDKFISSISQPPAIDFGDEEKNKEYYTKAKSNLEKNTKISLISLAMGAIGTACGLLYTSIKKTPEKISKSLYIGLGATCVSLLVGQIKKGTSTAKESKE